MGCHTWFYRKIDVSYEEARNKVLQDYINTLNALQTDVEDPGGIYNAYPEWIPKKYDFISLYERMIRMVENGYCKVAVMNKFQIDSAVTVYINEKHYVSDVPFYDIFRIDGYPNDRLFSYQETLDFIERNKNEVYSWLGWIGDVNTVGKYDNMIEIWKHQLKQFWYKYPDGMINFG